MGKFIKVLVADDSKDVRTRLQAVLEDTGKIKVIGMAENHKKVINLFKQLKPDAVILDIKIPEKGGIETAIDLYEISSRTPIIILRDYPDLRFRAISLKSEHIVFLDKSKEFEDIPSVLRKLCQDSGKKKGR
jgi:DNA-binding NarL/FixJ family response regulator